MTLLKSSQQRKNSTKLCSSNCTSRVLLAVSPLPCYLKVISCPHTETKALKIKGKRTENRVGDTEYPEGLKTIFQINWTESKQHQYLSSVQHLVSAFFSCHDMTRREEKINHFLNPGQSSPHYISKL